MTLKKLTSSTSRISGNWTYGIQISSPFSSYQHRSSNAKVTLVNKKTGRKYLFSEIEKNKLNLFENGYNLSRIGEIKPRADVKMSRNPEFLIQLKHFEDIPEFTELKHLMQEESFIDTKDYFVF